MKEEFLKNLYLKQQQKEQVPSNKVIANWASRLICILYPEMSKCSHPTWMPLMRNCKNFRMN